MGILRDTSPENGHGADELFSPPIQPGVLSALGGAAPDAGDADPTGAAAPSVAVRHADRAELGRQRDALIQQVAELHWDLGGLAYEMAIRDHFRLDVLVRRAAILQERDAQLAEVERRLRSEQA